MRKKGKRKILKKPLNRVNENIHWTKNYYTYLRFSSNLNPHSKKLTWWVNRGRFTGWEGSLVHFSLCSLIENLGCTVVNFGIQSREREKCGVSKIQFKWLIRWGGGWVYNFVTIRPGHCFIKDRSPILHWICLRANFIIYCIIKWSIYIYITVIIYLFAH